MSWYVTPDKDSSTKLDKESTNSASKTCLIDRQWSRLHSITCPPLGIKNCHSVLPIKASIFPQYKTVFSSHSTLSTGYRSPLHLRKLVSPYKPTRSCQISNTALLSLQVPHILRRTKTYFCEQSDFCHHERAAPSPFGTGSAPTCPPLTNLILNSSTLATSKLISIRNAFMT